MIKNIVLNIAKIFFFSCRKAITFGCWLTLDHLIIFRFIKCEEFTQLEGCTQNSILCNLEMLTFSSHVVTLYGRVGDISAPVTFSRLSKQSRQGLTCRMSITEQNFSSSVVIKNQQNFPLFICKESVKPLKKCIRAEEAGVQQTSL